MQQLPVQYGDIKIFSGSSNHIFAEQVCNYIGIKLSDVSISRFPDGEIRVQIEESIRGDDVFIIQSTNAPANENYMELLILIDAAKRASAGRITAVLPFFGYARQDRKDRPRVPVTAKLIANLLVAAGADRILSLDMHSQQLVGFFDIPVDHLFAASLFIKFFRQTDISNLTVCSPDFGSTKMAVAYADALQRPIAMVGKRRYTGDNVEALDAIGEISGRDILLVDDQTVTAKTLVEAAKLLKKLGANRVKAAVTHCVLNTAGRQLVANGPIDELYVTNTVKIDNPPNNMTIISVHEMFGKAISHIHNNTSITKLFEITGF